MVLFPTVTTLNWKWKLLEMLIKEAVHWLQLIQLLISCETWCSVYVFFIQMKSEMLLDNYTVYKIKSQLCIKIKFFFHYKNSKACIITFLSSHFERINRLFGSGALESGCALSSQTNQSTYGWRRNWSGKTMHYVK